MKINFPFYKQPDSKDCGSTCLRIIAKYYGKLISLQEIRELSETTRIGSNLLKLSDTKKAVTLLIYAQANSVKILPTAWNLP
ncbi:cysteine peptidase family C39 domain-containing protein [Galbibacter orientalis]|uniref:cysteine peptidase family C39 domain-containing protein n=1 Tax=Galbibacter orientalis TaxID=453852 RepID=UPI0002DAA393|nr:cysteine peptidase family C39 domain-containing protein [Galbibacter orientalis]